MKKLLKKELIFWCPSIGNVGTIKAVLESAKSLSTEKNYNCKIINSFGEFDRYRHILKKHNIEEVNLLKNRILYKLPKFGFFWSRFNYLLIFIFNFYPLLRLLKKNENAYIFIYLITSLPLILTSIFNLKNKIIFRVSGKINFTYLRKLIYVLSKKHIKKILIQTQISKKKIVETGIFKKNKIIFLRDPIIDHELIKKMKKKKIENHFIKKKFFVSIGRLSRQKNFLFLVKCLKKILEKEKLLFLIIGDGEEKKKIKEYIQRFKLSKNIILLGYRQNIFKYLSRSSGLICTSLWEEPGFVIQEAAACKKIILTSDCESGPAEFVGYGKTGFVFESNIQKSFIDKFNQLLDQQMYHKKMIEENYHNTKFYTKKYFLLKMNNILK